ncbi:methionine synthase [Vulcanimicrobium alpinum]|uniref:Methionine synthase n=1 Tax=Vulcanimicrobium alpinum TaxID=3016050 RepID=A0AAN1XXF9_UNVUL|nr:methionine synthase [Vulcanimicrobium alpinum]BDE07190.1 methionine synthase [Vulcanimicrobium alpinum]
MAEYLTALRERVLLFDGAMGTQLMAQHLRDEDFGGAAYHGCNEALVLTRPDLIEAIHRDYFAAGADVVETDSFTASRLKLDEYGLGAKTREINLAAAQLARRAADAFATPERPRFVAGALGPTGMLISSSDPALSKITFDQLADLYQEQAAALIEGGVDLLLLETSQDLLEMKAAIAGIVRGFDAGVRRVPIQAQATLDVTGRMLLGTDIAAVCATLDALPIDVIGLNCSTGPTHMRDPIRYLVEHSRCFVSVIPNAGLPKMGPKGETIYPETPDEMGRELSSFVGELGVNAIGGCCGTTPEHIAAFRSGLDALAASGRRPRIPDPQPLQLAASAMTAVALRQEGTVLLIGERVNSQGSRKIKRLLLADDYDEITLVARGQVEGGAHLLDVCTALTERTDEDVQMATIVKRLAQSVEAPLVIDSTEPKVIEAALKIYAGRPVVNSIHLENGRVKIDSVMPLVKEAGAAVVALTIDEAGMAKTAQRKLEVAQRIHDIVVHEYGLPAGALIFDDLTFTLATGDTEYIDSAVETIEGIRAIKRELPGVLTSLGVSNVSFGLKPAARHVLNSVMLHHCVEAGLDMAIVNAAEITPYAEIDAYERELCDDLVLNRRPDALQRVIEHFEAKVVTGGGASAAVEDDTDQPVEVRIHQAILRRRKDGIEAKIDEALARRDPVDVLNNVLLPAMKEVGDKFGAGELILPFVLQSAEVMKKAVAHLEQFLERKEGVTKGVIVLATVFGDVHDIGKNLVGTILSNNGYTVHDLGKQVRVGTILDKAVEVNADAIGLSALLVSTSKQMPTLVKEQVSRGLEYPVVIGGAAINRDFGRRTAFAPDRFFEPGVFYAKDAFEGLELLDALTDDVSRAALVERLRGEAETLRAKDTGTHAASATAGLTARPELGDADVPAPPFFGARTVKHVDVRELWPCFDLRSLYRLSWGAANTKGDEFDRLVAAEFEPRLRRYQSLAESGALLAPRVVYGYFPAAGSGDDVIVYDPQDRAREIARFTFARQAGGEHLCLADYLREPDGGAASDVIALQVVTMGNEPAERIEALQARNDYSEAYFLHGFSVQSAEALAERTHQRVRDELGLSGERGKRYSWGYGACPDLSQHELVWKLLDVEKAIGASLTAAHQIMPEQSTAAIVIHHPRAAYFNAAAVRELAAV